MTYAKMYVIMQNAHGIMEIARFEMRSEHRQCLKMEFVMKNATHMIAIGITGIVHIVEILRILALLSSFSLGFVILSAIMKHVIIKMEFEIRLEIKMVCV